MTCFKKKIHFIINPISGGYNKAAIIKAIPELLNTDKFDIFVSHSEHYGHAAHLAKKAVENNIDIVAAVGGDGTINRIATQLVNTSAALAIVPCGSGNGLARDLGIPLHYEKSIQLINELKTKKIDVGVCNQQYFFSLAGAGFDAKVAHEFNKGKKRKLLGYAWAVLKDFFKENSRPYEIKLDNETIKDRFFFVTAGNCSQWGYNVKVAPDAKLNDNLLSVNLCKKPSVFLLVPFGIKLLSGKIETSKYCNLKTAQNISINANHSFYYHIDGEAKGITQIMEIDILHEALQVVIK
jgi:YegS/Rv2252/BmrU family lipid kinase